MVASLLGELRRRLVHAARLEEDVAHLAERSRPRDQVATRRVDGRHLRELGERLVGGPLVHVGHRRPEVSGPPLAVVARDRGQPGVRLAGLGRLAHEDVVVPDPDVGGHEVRVDGESLLVAPDRLLESPHLHQELRVGVVRVRVVRYQLDVLLERTLRLVVLAEEAIGVAHLVVGLRERGVDGGRLRVGLDRRRVVLPPEVVGAHEIVGALVVGTGGDQLGEAVLLARRLALCARVEGADEEPLRLRGLAGEGHGPGDGVEELLGRPRRARKADLGQREARVLRGRLLEQGPRVGGAQLLREISALQVQLSRLLRRRRDRDLVGRRRGRGGAEDAEGQGEPGHSRGLHVSPPESDPSKVVPTGDEWDERYMSRRWTRPPTSRGLERPRFTIAP